MSILRDPIAVICSEVGLDPVVKENILKNGAEGRILALLFLCLLWRLHEAESSPDMWQSIPLQFYWTCKDVGLISVCLLGYKWRGHWPKQKPPRIISLLKMCGLRRSPMQ